MVSTKVSVEGPVNLRSVGGELKEMKVSNVEKRADGHSYGTVKHKKKSVGVVRRKHARTWQVVEETPVQNEYDYNYVS